MDVLVTGSSRGIGRATAEFFLAKGHRVTGLDLLEPTISADDYEHLVADVRNPETFPKDRSFEVIVNVAGVQHEGGDPDALEDIATNLVGCMNICETYALKRPNSACPASRIRAVVNVGSASGHTGSEFPAYAASKGGVIAYTKNLALRLAPQATCNSIDPGGVLTELNRPVMDDGPLWKRIMDLTPLRRWADPTEIAEWIYFVAVVNRFMTGQNLLIDGGEAGRAEFVWPKDDGGKGQTESNPKEWEDMR